MIQAAILSKVQQVYTYLKNYIRPNTDLLPAIKAQTDLILPPASALMWRTQSATGTGGFSSSYATVLTVSSSPGRVFSLYMKRNNSSGSLIYLRITIDGGSPVIYTSRTGPANSMYRFFQSNLTWDNTDNTYDDQSSSLLNISFKTSLLVEAMNTSFNGDTFYIKYDLLV